MTINLRFVVYQLGLLTLVLSAAMGCVALWSGYDGWLHAGVNQSKAMGALALATGLGIVVGLTLWGLGRKAAHDTPGRREALLMVALTWLGGAAFSALPYYLWWWIGDRQPHPFGSFIACYFESMSGLTTTGATVLSHIAQLPDGLLLWRAMTHWLGGLGIVVLFVAVLPTLGVGGKRLFQVEAPGPKQEGVRPRIRETARVLWLIYVLLTLVQVLAYRAAGMDWFDAVCHTFATLATGGFSTHDASIGYYDSWVINVITIVFMVLAGINFGLYYQLLKGRTRHVWRDPEVRLYLSMLALATLIIASVLAGQAVMSTTGQAQVAGVGTALQDAAFAVTSIQTTTGFGTSNFNLWPFVCKAVLLGLMFVGGCAGSTGGGIKVIRILIALKVIFSEVERVFRPQVVRTIRVGQGVVTPEMRQAVLVYVLTVLGLFAAGAIALMMLEPAGSITFTTAATASIATLNNVGPGLAQVGPIENYGFFSPASQLVMSLLMLLGRLEVYALFVLFLPSFWRSE